MGESKDMSNKEREWERKRESAIECHSVQKCQFLSMIGDAKLENQSKEEDLTQNWLTDKR